MGQSHSDDSADGGTSDAATGRPPEPEVAGAQSPVAVDTLLTIRAEKWVQQGFCLGYLEADAHNERGFPVFLHGALPGEEVRARVNRSNNRHCFALVEDILSPAPEREASDCAVFPRCGGCSFRHISYANEVALKLRLLDELKFLRECLERARSLDAFQIHTGAENGYRTRARLHRAGRDDPPGFYELHSNRIVPLPETAGCRQLAPDLNTEVLQELASRKTEVHQGKARPGRHHTLQLELDDPIEIDGSPWRIPTGAFFQANQFLLNQWLQAARAMIAGKHIATSDSRRAQSSTGSGGGRANALELFCGSGLLGGALRDLLGDYAGYDNAPAGLKAARKNFKQRGYAGRFENRDLYRRPIEVPPGTEVALINPPRAGMNQRQIPLLADAGVDRILYSSCNPATLNRDLAKFLERGYRAQAVGVFDFFPRTPHVEVLILLEREPGTSTMAT